MTRSSNGRIIIKRTIITGEAFSLIELMVVIAIVAVLSALSLPAYQTYRARAQATASYNAVQDVVIKKMTEYRNSHGSFPDSAATLGVSAASLSDLGVVSFSTGNGTFGGSDVCQQGSINYFLTSLRFDSISMGNINVYATIFPFTNGTTQVLCQYIVCKDLSCAEYLAGDIISGCTNFNATNNADFSVPSNSIVFDGNSYSKADLESEATNCASLVIQH